MKTETFLKKVSVALSMAILIVGVSACAHHDAAEGQDYGQVRTEASATESTSAVVGTAPAPSNAQNVEGTTTPAIISGPAKVDSTGRAYTSSSTGGSGNASATGLNTNVNIIPEKSSSEVIVTQTPAVTTTETTIVETTTPTPIVETPVVTETPTEVPMASSTTQETTTQETTTSTETTTHRRMRKD